jgi:DNA-binding transcriptional LysR family regulator
LRAGYRATELAQRLCRHAEVIEAELGAARDAIASSGPQLSGTVRISAVDAVLNSFVVPAAVQARELHPQLRIELLASNELSSLTHRDVDIALRSTDKPPGHLVGKCLGQMRFAVCAGRDSALARPRRRAAAASRQFLAEQPWIAVDEAMPDHPGVAWRRREFPKLRPALLCNSMQTVAQLIEQGAGIGVVACFHARRHAGLVPITPVLERCEIGLWLLTHPESRHLRRIAEVAAQVEMQVRSLGLD